ncbi:hypothetical protein [Streptomyces wedmorensis]
MPRPRAARPLRGWVTVSGSGLAEDSVLDHWITAVLTFVGTPPPE